YLGESYTRSFIQRLISDEKILVNKKVIKSGYKVKIGDVVSILDFDIKRLDILAQDIFLDIVYEDSDVIIVNKEQGMIVHPAQNIYKDTLVNALMYYCKDLSSINGVERPGIIHRIDKDTSGLLVVAKNDLSHKFLSEQFKIHSIRREYVALVHGVIKKSEGLIKTNIGRNPQNRIKMAVVQKGKEAITEYKVLRRYRRCTLVKCKLHTGRTHQIRLHMSHLGFPLVGDPIYGIKNENIYRNGQLLHARLIGFIHPTSNKYIEFKSSLPKHFKNVIKSLC
ncbi:Pseudouridine synthase, partial [Candidatus Arthromitus sp. SFB-1]